MKKHLLFFLMLPFTFLAQGQNSKAFEVHAYSEEKSNDKVYSISTTNDADHPDNLFSKKKHTISVEADPVDAGNVSGGGNYNDGETATLNATANSGYIFVNWTDVYGNVYSDNPFSFTVDSANRLTAHFAKPELIGETRPCHRQKCTYIVTGVDNAFRYFWETTDPNAIIEGSEDSVSVYWGTTENNHTLSVTILRWDWNPVIKKELNNIEVVSEINQDEANHTIATKKLHGSGKDYILIYTNPDTTYNYQWFRNDSLLPGANKQYLYQKGGLDDGTYKVYISKDEPDENGDLICGAFSPEYTVSSVTIQTPNLTIYPNPSSVGTNLIFVNENEGESQLSIYSVDGKLLHCQTVTDHQAIVNINLPQGMYIARLTNGQDVKVERIVIQ
jgi:hypothetical protein